MRRYLLDDSASFETDSWPLRPLRPLKKPAPERSFWRGVLFGLGITVVLIELAVLVYLA